MTSDWITANDPAAQRRRGSAPRCKRKLAGTVVSKALPRYERSEMWSGTLSRNLPEDETTDSSSNSGAEWPKQHRSEPRKDANENQRQPGARSPHGLPKCFAPCPPPVVDGELSEFWNRTQRPVEAHIGSSAPFQLTSRRLSGRRFGTLHKSWRGGESTSGRGPLKPQVRRHGLRRRHCAAPPLRKYAIPSIVRTNSAVITSKSMKAIPNDIPCRKWM